MANIVQLVVTSICGIEGRGFNPRYSPVLLLISGRKGFEPSVLQEHVSLAN